FRRLALATLAATVFAAPAFAQEAPAQAPAGGDNGLDITATITGVSDYRFRGVSESGRDPALQGSVDVTYHGFYVGAWASSIARTADTNAELDLYAGYSGSAGPVEYEVGAIAYLYPGGDGTGNIYEATGSLSYTLAPATVTAFAGLGRERGSFYGSKWDWSLGFEVTRGPFTASLAYVDTNLDSATNPLGRAIRAGVVARVSLGF